MIITDSFVKQFKGKQPKWGFGDLGYVVYKRSYAREVEGRTEEFYETLQRAINGAQELGAEYTKEEAERLFRYMWDMKGLYAGRMLWQLGTNNPKRFGMNSLVNCWYINMDSLESFLFLFENLMLGGGVGFSVAREHIYQLPKIKPNVTITLKNEKDADFIVPDSREGWVQLMKKVLKSYFYTGKSFSYSTILIRGYGEKISTFGGTASGAGILIEGIEKICEVMKTREGKQLRSVDVLDICNLIGKIVVSGNVRRSAEIALGDVDDQLFLSAKRWDKGNIPNHRAMSNNSLYCPDIEYLLPSFWEGYSGNGEPYGLVNMKLSRKYGRIGDIIKDNCEGFNPCGEIALASWECCNLSETFINNITSKEEMLDVAILLYKTQKAICNGKWLHEETEKIVHKNNRIGITVSGIMQSADKLNWLDYVYKGLRKFDKQWSKERGWNESIKLTAVQPSGTKALITGSTSGGHPAFAEYLYRTVQMASDDKLVELCRKAGYRVEYKEGLDGTKDYNSVVVYFPLNIKNATYAKDMTAIAQLETVKMLQTKWADNAVSVTVYYRKEELPAIKEWLKENYKTNIKSVSFLLHSDHGFNQAVYQEITKEEYEEAVSKISKLDYSSAIFVGKDMMDCEGGSCGVNDILIT